ncbi:UNVERIFIED_CONTAM: hypothetical protein PYX00_008056 [Menopon gallinae]|uniref:Uncharacterized protein n=1 Tax=Menopon gallinae TaxID=328185 RepID=A0AAW2HLJ6_9NEOP
MRSRDISATLRYQEFLYVVVTTILYIIRLVLAFNIKMQAKGCATHPSDGLISYQEMQSFWAEEEELSAPQRIHRKQPIYIIIG